ncbi:MAG: F0F1 ATP synthase subunit I [Alphaproteobacteria bacterium]|nr:F0F1 ATP synthase subunit I [Alphaproteobacteria bacterium]
MEKSSLEDLSARVKKARKNMVPEDRPALNDTQAYGMAMRLVAELLSGLFVGFVIGWFLDKWLGTKPWLLITFIFLGLCAGIFNVMRAAKQIEAAAARKRRQKTEGNEG